MSIHSTLRTGTKDRRNVKTRRERINDLLEKGQEVKSAYGLPKEKIIRFKLAKKEKKEKVIEETAFDYVPPKTKKNSKDIGKIK